MKNILELLEKSPLGALSGHFKITTDFYSYTSISKICQNGLPKNHHPNFEVHFEVNGTYAGVVKFSLESEPPPGSAGGYCFHLADDNEAPSGFGCLQFDNVEDDFDFPVKKNHPAHTVIFFLYISKMEECRFGKFIVQAGSFIPELSDKAEEESEEKTLHDLIGIIDPVFYTRFVNRLSDFFSKKIRERISEGNSLSQCEKLKLIKISELLEIDKRELLKTYNLGEKTIAATQQALIKMGYKKEEHLFLKKMK